MELKRIKRRKILKGFTLVELLAIIVVLAIVSVISVPIITNIIRTAREKAFLNSAYGVLEAAEYYYARQSLEIGYNGSNVTPLSNKVEGQVVSLNSVEKTSTTKSNGNDKIEKIILPDTKNKLNLKGKGLDGGTVYIKSRGSIALSIWNEDLKLCAVKTYEESEITFGDRKLTKEECGEGNIVENVGTSGDTWDGWITLTLYYPEESTERKWRIGASGEVREEDWKEYEGPITIPLSDVENVYIKYKVGGKTVIVPPKGTIYVDIEPSNFEIPKSGGRVTATINATDKADIYYKIGSSWEKYNSLKPIELTVPGIIEAKAELKEDVYDSEGNKLYTRKLTAFDSVYIREKGTDIGRPIGSGSTGGTGGTSGGPKRNPETGKIIPSYYIEGPTIAISPTTTTNKVEVSLSTKEVARTMYIKVGNNPYEEYTEPVEVSSNTSIYAYYVRNSDGATSDTSYKRINNIYVQGYNCNMPNIEMKTTPGLNYKYASKIELEITTDGEDLEYSNDGVVYERYDGKIEITKNGRIYARTTNDCGTSTEYIDITNIGSKGVVVPPIKKQKLSVSITAVTEPSVSEGYEEEVEVTINYDSKAVNKYYKIGYNGKLQTYTGPFKMTKNETVYAYAVSVTGYGEASKIIDNIGDKETNTPAGLTRPIIKANPNNSSQTNEVEISITYDKNATTKQYRIGNGSLRTYNGPFKVKTNETIYAVNIDSEGNKKDTTYTISNISTTPIYILNKGEYFIIKLNYPSSSKESSREYRFGNNAWTKYKTDGILLATANANINNNGKIMITDENGDKVEFKGDYYKINCAPSEILQNIVMRWDTSKPATPEIIVMPIDPTREVTVKINYDDTSKVKEYKIVKPDGTMTDWQKYTAAFKIKDKNTIVYARAQNESEVYSEEGIYKITNIDEEAPVIKLTADLTTKTQNLNVRVSVVDDVLVDTVMYTKGIKGESYFKTGGTLISNNSIVKITENGDYTFYAKDGVGNEQVYTIKVENIDTTAPNIKITDLSTKVGLETEVEIEYGDSTTKKYKIGEKTTTWITYTDKLTITSSDIISKKLGNSDGTITVCAQGTDDVGNKEEVCTRILTVDIDVPSTPIITSNANYPVLTEYGIKLDGRTTIKYDTRTDIDNYYSLDGTTWNKYTREFEVTSGTIYAKSVKKGTGLTVSTTITIGIPSDALGVNAYDNDASTYISAYRTTKDGYLNVDPTMYGKSVSLNYKYTDTAEFRYSKIIIYFYDDDNNKISSQNITKTNNIITIPYNTKKMNVQVYASLGDYTYLYEFYVYNNPIINATQYYPKLTGYGVDNSYALATIDYFNTSVQKLYKIDDGDWQVYQDKKIRVELGKTLYAKGVDANGNDSNVQSYASTLPSDALGVNAYDEDESTVITASGTTLKKYVDVDPSMQGKQLISTYTLRRDTNYIKYSYYNGDELISSESSNAGSSFVGTIPENTTKILFELRGYTTTYPFSIKEVAPYNSPTINVSKIYPKLTQYGVEKGYDLVTIDYFDTSVQRLYKIDDGDWQVYQNKKIRLEENQVLYAKSIDKNNIDSIISSYTSTLPTDALGLNAYDNDDSTVITASGTTLKKYIDVDPSMQGKQFISKYALRRDSNYIKYNYYNGEELISSESSNAGSSFVGTIPVNTTKILFEFRGYTTTYPFSIKEVMAYNAPKITAVENYPKLTEAGIQKGYASMTINYFDTSVQKLYKIGEESEWKKYNNEPIKVTTNETLYAKGIDKNNVESIISTYTSTLPTDALGLNAYDNNESTLITSSGTAVTKFIDVDPSMQGKQFISKYALRRDSNYIKYNYYNGTELISSETSNTGSSFIGTIPLNTTRIQFEIKGTTSTYSCSLKEVSSST